MRLGPLIKEIRTAKGVTLRKLANDVHVSYPYISQIENGRFYPSRETVENISKVLKNNKIIQTYDSEKKNLKDLVRRAKETGWRTYPQADSTKLLSEDHRFTIIQTHIQYWATNRGEINTKEEAAKTIETLDLPKNSEKKIIGLINNLKEKNLALQKEIKKTSEEIRFLISQDKINTDLIL